MFCVAASAALACDFPISGSKYRIDDGGTAFSSGAEGAAKDRGDVHAAGGNGLEQLDSHTRAIVQAFARDDEECATAFVAACTDALTNCAASSGCVDYSICMRERAAPSAETTCSDDGDTSLEDSWRFELVRHCWASRYAECDLGRNFECVGDYGPPSGERVVAEVRQQVLVRGAEGAGSEFTISFCPEWSDCSEPVVQVATNRVTGVYDATLPVGGKNFGVGNEWRGYRLVRGPDIPDSIVAANIPIWGRRVEITRVLSTQQVGAFSFWYEADIKSSVMVQIVDCLADPAPGISFELPTSATAIINYVDGDGSRVPDQTVASGAAGISGYDPEELQTISAMRDGEIVATWSGELSSGKPRYVRLHPMGSR